MIGFVMFGLIPFQEVDHTPRTALSYGAGIKVIFHEHIQKDVFHNGLRYMWTHVKK